MDLLMIETIEVQPPEVKKVKQPPKVGPFGELYETAEGVWKRRLNAAGKAFLANRPKDEAIRLTLTKCKTALAKWRALFGEHNDEWQGVVLAAAAQYATAYDPDRSRWTTLLVSRVIPQALGRQVTDALRACRDVRRKCQPVDTEIGDVEDHRRGEVIARRMELVRQWLGFDEEWRLSPDATNVELALHWQLFEGGTSLFDGGSLPTLTRAERREVDRRLAEIKRFSFQEVA